MKIIDSIRKFKDKVTFLMIMLMTFILARPALADVTEINAESFNTKLLGIIEKYLQPLGGSIILIAVIIGGVKLLVSAYSPERRKETMGGLGYVLLGAIFIGGAMFFAGAFLGLGKSFDS